MKFTVQFLREHQNIILMQLLFAGIFAVVFFLYHLPLAAVLYPAFICFITGCLFGGRSLYQAYQKHKDLSILQSLPANALPDAFPEDAAAVEKSYQQIIRNLLEETRSMEHEMTSSYNEMTDYFTVWVHQIKTPIASMRLHLEGEDSKLSRRLNSDLLHIEQYVGMVLTYFKMGSDATDYVFRTVCLDEIIKENIRKLRGDFIIKKLNLIYTPSDETVISDAKWLSFVIEQILSNALKYTSEGSVTISFEKPGILCISDTGIGISLEDIPRIFEKGYTGYNGHEERRASGLGLYLCKQICNRLGHQISADSEVEAGTTIKIDFNQHRHLNK